MTTTTDDTYDLDSVWQLLARNCDLPDTDDELRRVLGEYRTVLHALATDVQATQHGLAGQQSVSPATSDDAYDLGLVWQFLAQDREPPDTEQGLLLTLREHRAALHGLATRVQATQPGLASQEPSTPGSRP